MARGVNAFPTRLRSRRCSGSSSMIMLRASAAIDFGSGKGIGFEPLPVARPRLRRKRGSVSTVRQSS